MKKYLIFLLSILVLGLGFGVIFAENQQSLIENFDSYNDGPLNGQGGWLADPCFEVGASYRYGPSGKGVYCSAGERYASKFFKGRVAGSQVFYIKTTSSGADLYTRFYEDGAERFDLRMRWNNRWSIGHPNPRTGWLDFGSWTTNIWYKAEVEWDANRGINGQARARINDGTWSDWKEADTFFNRINKIMIGPSTPPGYWDEFSDPGIQLISAFIDFDPDTLNLESKGKWVTTYIELPDGYDINDINLESIKLNDQIFIELKPTKVGDYDNDGIADLMVKFSRLAVQNILEPGDEVEITITGALIDGTIFQGSDVIKVISK